VRRQALPTLRVEEAYGHVQGASLKPYAALLVEAFKLPDRQAGKMDIMLFLFFGLWIYFTPGLWLS
jgi:hypothetical protein